MAKKKQLIELEECIDLALNDPDFPSEPSDALYDLEDEAPFIFPRECSDSGWEIVKEAKNTLKLHTTDECGCTKIHCFVYIYGYGTYVMKKAQSIQGEGYDDDLDEIYVTYEKRDNLNIQKDVECAWENIAKKYKLYK